MQNNSITVGSPLFPGRDRPSGRLPSRISVTLRAIAAAVLYSVAVFAACAVALGFFAFLAGLGEANQAAGAVLTVLGFFVDCLALTSKAGLGLLCLTTFIAPGLGAAAGARSTLDDASTTDIAFSKAVPAVAPLCALLGIGVIAALTDTTWTLARQEDLLPSELIWTGTFYSNSIVPWSIGINAVVAAFVAYKGDS